MNKIIDWVVSAEFPFPDVELIETDGIPLESPWHQAAISLLIEILTCLFRDRDDFFCGGNNFIYYSSEQARNRDYKGPDFYYVNGVPRRKERLYWCVWEENGRYPNLIVELSSPTTAHLDRTTKKDLYESTFRTPEYYCYDPETHHLEGWRLDNRQRYQPIPGNERGWLWSEELQLWLGNWEGEYLGLGAIWLRFYDKEERLVPINAEMERQQTEAERRRAEAERRRAEAAEQRAKAAEAELTALKAKLAQG